MHHLYLIIYVAQKKSTVCATIGMSTLYMTLRR